MLHMRESLSPNKSNQLCCFSGLFVRACCHKKADLDAPDHTRQFEMVRLGLSPETPVACQQWTGLIAINYPARAFGITRHMTVDEVPYPFTSRKLACERIV